jgi:hypothetical protein
MVLEVSSAFLKALSEKCLTGVEMLSTVSSLSGHPAPAGKANAPWIAAAAGVRQIERRVV